LGENIERLLTMAFIFDVFRHPRSLHVSGKNFIGTSTVQMR
jgi:hypothetical protein